jgi:hypothetical protein
MQSQRLHTIWIRSTLILSSSLHVCLTCRLFPVGFQLKFFIHFSSPNACHMSRLYPCLLILTYVRSVNYEVPQCVIFIFMLPPNISRVTMLFPLWRSTSTSSNIIQGVVTTYRTIWCVDHAIAQAVSRRLLSAEASVHASVSPCGICGGLSGTGAGSFWSPSVFPCRHHSTSTSYSLISSEGWTNNTLEAQFYRDIVSTNGKNIN